jgi:uncharacterized protein YllA (UPF0747 family)
MLLEQNRRLDCSRQSLENIEQLKQDNAFLVTCGHQACLGGGPLYVAYKILTCIKAAACIEKDANIPVKPLFWLAADDDDLGEVTQYTCPEQKPFIYDTAGYAGIAGAMPPPGKQFKDLPALHADNWGGYHAKLIHHLFGKWGIITMSPLARETGDLRKEFFSAFINLGDKAYDAVGNRSRDINASGFNVQVKPRKNDRFLYSLEAGKRRRLTGQFKPAGEWLLTSALSRLLSMEYSLPLILDVSGPSEIGYHAQTEAMYRLLDRTMPVILPRFSATLVRSRDREVLNRYSIEIPDLIANRHLAEMRLADHLIPEDLKQTLSTLSGDLKTVLEKVKDTFSNLDPSLTGSVDAGIRKADGIKNYLSKKLSAALRRKLKQDNRREMQTFDFIFPGKLQERSYNFLYFKEEIPDFLDKIYDLIDPFDFEHKIIDI